ncbi:MAG: polyphenol oxidase family protein [Acidimicrobiales bacterium]
MARTISERLGFVDLSIQMSDRSDGSLRVTEPSFPSNLDRFLSDTAGLTWLRQVHGDRIITVEQPGQFSGAEADGAFTTEIGPALAISSADCAPVVIAASDGPNTALAMVHAGWRGLLAGIVEKGCQMVLDAVPDGTRLAYCGPCIGPDSYEFSGADLVPLAERYGDAVRSRTESGTESLDLFAGVALALVRSGFRPPPRPPSTADPQYFSHRTGGDDRSSGRMLTVARLLHT